jgi:anti-anti-sigma regulatory factor
MNDGHDLQTTARRVVADSAILCDTAIDARRRARAVVETSRERRREPGEPAAFGVDVDCSSPPVTTLHVHGELDLATGPRLTEALLARLPDGPPDSLRIDLSAVTFVSVGVLRELLALQDWAARTGRPAAIVNESAAVLGLLAILGRFGRGDG